MRNIHWSYSSIKGRTKPDLVFSITLTCHLHEMNDQTYYFYCKSHEILQKIDSPRLQKQTNKLQKFRVCPEKGSSKFILQK